MLRGTKLNAAENKTRCNENRRGKRPLFEVQTMVVLLSFDGSLPSKQWLFTPLNNHRLQVKRVSFGKVTS